MKIKLLKYLVAGTLSVFYIVSFVMTKAGQWGWNVEFEDASSPLYIPFVRPSFPALSGMLSLALFLHNCVVAIMKNNRHPENNVNFTNISSFIRVEFQRVTLNA